MKYHDKQQAEEAFGRLLDIMDRLRVECPWDREQTFESLRNCTIEETYELVDAIAAGDMDSVRGELGDLLLHVVFYSKMGAENGDFDITDVIDGICDKLIFRHPHVFGHTEAETPEQVKFNWEQLKLKEKKKKRGILGGVPAGLPSMVKAYRVSEKAAAAGFDWDKKEDIWDKVSEEFDELKTELGSGSQQRREEEFGDILFTLINAGRLYGIDPELALERCNKKFIRRFNSMENYALEQDRQLSELPIAEMEELWCRAKQEEENN